MINFQEAGVVHFRWKHKIKAYLEGAQELSQDAAISHKECELGKWLYKEALAKYGNVPQMQELEKIHIELHATVRKIIQLKEAGDTAGANEAYKNLEEQSSKVVMLLTSLSTKIR